MFYLFVGYFYRTSAKTEKSLKNEEINDETDVKKSSETPEEELQYELLLDSETEADDPTSSANVDDKDNLTEKQSKDQSEGASTVQLAEPQHENSTNASLETAPNTSLDKACEHSKEVQKSVEEEKEEFQSNVATNNKV